MRIKLSLWKEAGVHDGGGRASLQDSTTAAPSKTDCSPPSAYATATHPASGCVEWGGAPPHTRRPTEHPPPPAPSLCAPLLRCHQPGAPSLILGTSTHK